MYRPVPLCDIFQVVRTGTYYIIVQVGTGRYVPVRTDMYQVYRIPDEAKIIALDKAFPSYYEQQPPGLTWARGLLRLGTRDIVCDIGKLNDPIS